MEETLSSVETIWREVSGFLARTFPVACASDEFFYFPQVRLEEPQWGAWDRFSREGVDECARRLADWEGELDRLESGRIDPDLRIDATLHRRLCRTLREQLTEVKAWQTQPTWYLTLVCVGLAEAMEEPDPAAGHDRAAGLAPFLDQAGRNLLEVPLIFRDIGLEMVPDTVNYLASLVEILPELRSAFPALERFRTAVLSATTRDDFLLPRDLLERIYRFHLACGMGIGEIQETLDGEIREVEEVLEREGGCLLADRPWPEAIESIPVPDLGKRGVIEGYRDEVERLAGHCLERQWISPELLSACPVTVAPVPDFLSAIRSASSYSIPPGHPPTGGTFSIIDPHGSQGEDHRECSMLCAHETYPGHHLLDISRWGLERPWRRAVELPVFYEGWACFAEELMRLTGWFDGPADRLLLARRRLWRAVRGRIDIGLQTGRMDISEAAGSLRETGIGERRAIGSARRYPLNPGYQQCYTIGLRRFLHLFDTYGRGDERHFVQTVLSQGEIGFESLEEVLRNTGH